MQQEIAELMNEAGTGFMDNLTKAIRLYQQKGYTENLVPRYDHFECQSGRVKLYAGDIKIDDMLRFENTSDPDDQSIMYAVSAPTMGLKGLYVDSYGLYHDDLAPVLVDHLRVLRPH